MYTLHPSSFLSFLMALLFFYSFVGYLFTLKNIFLESPMVTYLPNIHSSLLFYKQAQFCWEQQCAIQKTILFSLEFSQFYSLDRSGHVTGFWTVRYKQKLLGRASGKFFIRGLTQQVGLFCPSLFFFLPICNTDRMAGAAAVIMWSWDNLEGRWKACSKNDREI